MKTQKTPLFVCMLVAATFALSPTLSAQSSVIAPTERVIGELDNPRGLAFGPQGALYVAEAGRGPTLDKAECLLDSTRPACADVPCVLTPSTFLNNSPYFPNLNLVGTRKPACSGRTGAITRLWQGRQDRVATGLPSWASVSAVKTFTLFGEGPDGVAMLGPGDAYLTIGMQDPVCDDGVPTINCVTPSRAGLGNGFAQLARVVLPTGHWELVADVGQYEVDNNPDDSQNRHRLDSNPFGLLALPGEQIVVDAGGNDVLRRDADTGTISTLAILQNDPSISTDGDGVPTSITRAPDGSLYVGQLTGLPFFDGVAKIYRLVRGRPATDALEPVCGGFKSIVSLAFDRVGNLYVLEIFTAVPSGGTGPGAIYRIDAATLAAGIGQCDRSYAVQIVPDFRRDLQGDQLSSPTSIIVGPDDALYVTNHGNASSFGADSYGNLIAVSNGEVLRIVVKD
jgi:hypothetical protein